MVSTKLGRFPGRWGEKSGARLERIYPLSVVTDGMGINITVVSYRNKVCMGITACPTELPGIEAMGKHVRAAYRDLCQSVD